MGRNPNPPNPYFHRFRKTGILFALYGFILVNLVWTLFPVYWTLLTSFKTIQQMNTMPPLFVFTPTLTNYIKILTGDALLTFRNSLLISTSAVLVGLLVGFPAAYTLARVTLLPYLPVPAPTRFVRLHDPDLLHHHHPFHSMDA
jgi:ABC-type glycerol-3-phosphate transport system permease component